VESPRPRQLLEEGFLFEFLGGLRNDLHVPPRIFTMDHVEGM
jgi:hypothetical protein